MTGLIKADFKKLFKSKTLLVCSLIALGISLLTVFVMHMVLSISGDKMQMAKSMMDMAGGDESIDMNVVLSQIPDNNIWSFADIQFKDGNINIFIAICVCVFVASEYNMGTLKNIVSRGFPRNQIYFSKLLVSVVCSVIITAVYVTSGAIMSTFWANEEVKAAASQIILSIISYMLIIFAMASLFLMIAVTVRKSGLSIAISIGAMMLISSIFEMLAMSIEHFENYSKYWLPNTLSIVSTSIKDGQWYVPMLIAAGYFAVTTIIGLLVFKKRDIK